MADAGGERPWDAAAAAAACPLINRRGTAWRLHNRRYQAADPVGSLIAPGRYNRDFPALYLSLREHVAVGEKTRHFDPAQVRLRRDRFRLSPFEIELQAVLLCCELPACTRSTVGRTRSQLCRAKRFDLPRPTISQQLAVAAYERGAEGMLVPSCTRFAGGNLVLFPTRVRPGSTVRVIMYEDAALFA